MQFVVDTNIVVAALIRKGDTQKLLLSNLFEFFSPDLVSGEVLKHKLEFMQKASMNEAEFLSALELGFENIVVAPPEEYLQFKGKALSICPEGHKDDWPFIALALKLDCAVWSNDSALKRQQKIKVFSTAEMLKKIE